MSKHHSGKHRQQQRFYYLPVISEHVLYGEFDDDDSDAVSEWIYANGVRQAIKRRLQSPATASGDKDKGKKEDGSGSREDELPSDLAGYELQLEQKVEELQKYKHKLFILMKQVLRMDAEKRIQKEQQQQQQQQQQQSSPVQISPSHLLPQTSLLSFRASPRPPVPPPTASSSSSSSPPKLLSLSVPKGPDGSPPKSTRQTQDSYPANFPAKRLFEPHLDGIDSNNGNVQNKRARQDLPPAPPLPSSATMLARSAVSLPPPPLPSAPRTAPALTQPSKPAQAGGAQSYGSSDRSPHMRPIPPPPHPQAPQPPQQQQQQQPQQGPSYRNSRPSLNLSYMPSTSSSSSSSSTSASMYNQTSPNPVWGGSAPPAKTPTLLPPSPTGMYSSALANAPPRTLPNLALPPIAQPPYQQQQQQQQAQPPAPPYPTSRPYYGNNNRDRDRDRGGYSDRDRDRDRDNRDYRGGRRY